MVGLMINELAIIRAICEMDKWLLQNGFRREATREVMWFRPEDDVQVYLDVWHGKYTVEIDVSDEEAYVFSYDAHRGEWWYNSDPATWPEPARTVAKVFKETFAREVENCVVL